MGKKEQEIIDYLKNNNGANLILIEPDLVLCSPSNIKGKECSFFKSINENPFFKNKFPNIDFSCDDLYFSNCDLYCFNEKDCAFVVIEVKTGKADFKTFGQILYYLINAEVIESVNEKKVKTLRGIILASKIDKTLKILNTKYKDKIPEIKLKEYRWTKEGKLIIKEPSKFKVRGS